MRVFETGVGYLGRRVLPVAAAVVLGACGGSSPQEQATARPAAMEAPAAAAATAPVVVTGPADTFANPGQRASFTVFAAGAPLRYQWRRNGVDIVGATAATYTTPAVTAGDTGASYRVVVRNAAGVQQSAPATLTVTDAFISPALVTQPRSASVAAEGSATFSAIAAGSELAYQWFRDGVAIRGATAARYVFRDASSGDSGALFTLRVRNRAGTAFSQPATLTVGGARVAPAIATAPTPTTATTGTRARLQVGVTGTPPLNYQWFRGGVAIEGATLPVYTTAALGRADDGALFSVTVGNAAGSATSQAVALDVIRPPVDPAIGSLLQSRNCLACHAYDQRVIGPSFHDIGRRYGGRQARLDYLVDRILQGGVGVWGQVPAPANTSVTPDQAQLLAQWFIDDANPMTVLPTIVSEPADGSTAAGGAVTFTVSAAGPGTLAYQWRRNGVDIVGATQPSYTTEATTLADDGARFTVRVRNAYGGVTSRAATLQVTTTTFPQGPVTLVVPFATGTTVDLVARDFALSLANVLGQSVRVENTAGAGGTFGTDRVAKAMADGYTLLFTDTSIATIGTLYRTLPFDPLADFAYLGLVDLHALLIVGRQTLAPTGITELRAWMQANGSTALLGHNGYVSTSYSCGLLLQDRLGADLTDVPYASTGVLTALLADDIDIACMPWRIFAPYVANGSLKNYGISSAERFGVLLPELTGTPSPATIGGLELSDWHGVYAPRATPPAVLNKLSAAVRAVLADPSFRQRELARRALVITDDRSTADGHRAFVEGEAGKLRPLIVAAGQYAL